MHPNEIQCDCCDDATSNAEDEYGEIVCDNCLQNRAEAAYERFCEDFHGGEIVTLREQQEAARKFK